jgi:hypothetical protein
MRKISLWASSHAQLARAFIVIIHGALLILVYFIGITSQDIGVTLPKNTFTAAGSVLMIIATLIYPEKNKSQYFKQKMCDFTIPFCACLILIATINNVGSPSTGLVAYGNNMFKSPTGIEISGIGEPTSTNPGPQKTFKRNILKQFKKGISSKQNNDPDKSSRTKKTLLIILAVIVMLLLLGLLSVLVCALACNGAWVAPTLVAVIGLAGIIWAFITVVRRITRGRKKTKAAKVD